MENDNLVVLIKIEKDLKKLENYLNNGYEIKANGHHGKLDYWVIGKPEIKPQIKPKEIESFRVLNPKSEDCQKETELLQKKGFKIDSVTSTTAIMIRYKEKEYC